jgi:putative ABC transport system substrate-binding protein
MIDRRTCLFGAAACLVSHAARAQPSSRVPRVVFQGFGPIAPGDNDTILQPFRDGLRELGYVEGRTIDFQFQHVDRKPERLPAALEDLARQGVDVIVAGQPQVVLAAMRASPAIPVVFAAIIDPIGAGIVRCLARPGGNATGLAWDSDPQIAAKQLQLLHELVPEGRTIGLMWNPEVQGSAAFVRAAEGAAMASEVTLRPLEVGTPAAIETAFAGMARTGVAAVIILGSDFAWLHRERLAEMAALHRVPAIYGNRDSVLSGGLMSYGPSLADQFRRAAGYVDKILRGARPADLPVQQPTKFELVVNLKAAKALEITIPSSLLLRADEVIR